MRLRRLSLPAFTQHRVLGRGCEQGLRYLPRQGADRGAGVRYLPKRMVSWVLNEAAVPRLIHAVLEANQTGHPGDGKIFVLPVEQMIELGTTEHPLEALPALESFEPATEVRLALPNRGTGCVGESGYGE